MIVMPRSRSSSLLSIARSATRSFARNVPLWCSSASTRVVLPWSTCAMIATLRRSGLATSALPACEEGFSTDKDILSVYWLFAQSREDLLRALAELLVVHDFPGKLTCFDVAREVVAGDRGIEPGRDDHAPVAGNLLFAFSDLTR